VCGFGYGGLVVGVREPADVLCCCSCCSYYSSC